MIAIEIPGFSELRLTDLVLDYNGTLAVDGQLVPGVATRLGELAKQLRVHVLTADTFGKARQQLAGVPVQLTIAGMQEQAEFKRSYVEQLGPARVVAIGNGRNDRLMMRTAALGLAVIQAEGVAVETLVEADGVVTGINDALDLLVNPQRLVATFRS